MGKTWTFRMLAIAMAATALSGCSRSKADQETIDQLTSQVEEVQGDLADAKEKAGDLGDGIGELKDSLNSLDDTDWRTAVAEIRAKAGELDSDTSAVLEALGCERGKDCS